jgi:nucleotide-binding universal stress UspA family protein
VFLAEFYMFNHVLLCTHGTEGARKAETFIFKLLDADSDLKVSVLTVLDEDWRDMTGDDWLNSSKTHTAFLDHVEAQVTEEITQDWQRIKDTYSCASQAVFIQRTGSIEKTIAKIAKELGCDLIAIGPYQKRQSFFTARMENGLRARMQNKTFHPLLPCPLLIAP